MAQPSSKRLILALASSLFFLIGFILNITSDTALYNIDLNVVPSMQANPSLGSSAFLGFMNVISNIFNPVICVGYVALFWLISSRKLEIMVFLVWFILLSWLLTILKVAIHQSRPYWNTTAGVQMLEWTCYSQFGCPSGHSMLGLLLIEFVIRFFMREYKGARRMAWLLYIILVVLQLLVMFSRVILGMHTFNQVLMGAMIGMYAISVYYLYAEAAIVCYFRSLLQQSKKKQHVFIIVVFMVCCFLLEILLTYLPAYDYEDTFLFFTQKYSRCSNVKYYKSFQYKCFEDSALLMAGIGLVVGYMFMKNPQNLTKPLAYTRLSWKFIGRLLLIIVLAAIPAAIFLNPFWADISNDNSVIAVIIWITQSIGFFLAIIMILLVAPVLCGKAGFELFKSSEYLEKTKAKEGKEELEMSRSSGCD